MRDATPVIAAITLNGSSIAGVINPPAYNSTTGEYLFSLVDAQFITPTVSSPILPGQSLVSPPLHRHLSTPTPPRARR